MAKQGTHVGEKKETPGNWRHLRAERKKIVGVELERKRNKVKHLGPENEGDRGDLTNLTPSHGLRKYTHGERDRSFSGKRRKETAREKSGPELGGGARFRESTLGKGKIALMAAGTRLHHKEKSGSKIPRRKAGLNGLGTPVTARTS